MKMISLEEKGLSMPAVSRRKKPEPYFPTIHVEAEELAKLPLGKKMDFHVVGEVKAKEVRERNGESPKHSITLCLKQIGVMGNPHATKTHVCPDCGKAGGDGTCPKCGARMERRKGY